MEKQFEIPKVGIDGAKYAKGVYTCPHCGETIKEPHHMYYHIIGLADTKWGKMKVVECPFCFEKYFSHVGNSDIYHIKGFADKNEHLKHLV